MMIIKIAFLMLVMGLGYFVALKATEEDLGTCWIGAYDAAEAVKILGLPEYVHPVVFVAVGYAHDEPKPKTRKPMEEIVRYEHW